MPTWDATTAHCHVFAWKEGVLSAFGHDVRLEVRRFEVRLEGETVTATFDPRTVKAVAAVRDGRDVPGTLSAKDLDTIDGYVQKDILDTRRFGEITFTSSSVDLEDGAGTVTGTLHLHGQRRTVTARLVRQDGRTVAKVRLAQPDFGITPFKAMLGALKMQAVVDVELSVPAWG